MASEYAARFPFPTQGVRVPRAKIPTVGIPPAQLRAITEAVRALEEIYTPELAESLERLAETQANIPAADRKQLSSVQKQVENVLKQSSWALDDVEHGLAAVEVAAKEEEAWELIKSGLKEKLGGGFAHLTRSEIETLGESAGLSRQESAELFEDHKDISWRGDYILSDEGWIGAWVEELY